MDLTVVPFPDMNTAAAASPRRSAASHRGTAGRCKGANTEHSVQGTGQQYFDLDLQCEYLTGHVRIAESLRHGHIFRGLGCDQLHQTPDDLGTCKVVDQVLLLRLALLQYVLLVQKFLQRGVLWAAIDGEGGECFRWGHSNLPPSPAAPLYSRRAHNPCPKTFFARTSWR